MFLLLLLTSLDLGRLLYSQITITNAAKEGALVASQGGSFQDGQPCTPSNTVMCGVLTEAKGGFVEVDQTRVELSPAVCDANAEYPSSGSPPNVAVSVEAPFDVITPIIGDIIGSNLTVRATAEAQCLVIPVAASVPMPTPTPCAGVVVPIVDGLDAPGDADDVITGVGLVPNGLDDASGGPKDTARDQSPDSGICVAAGSPVTYHYRT